jgi:hypothetical protein
VHDERTRDGAGDDRAEEADRPLRAGKHEEREPDVGDHRQDDRLGGGPDGEQPRCPTVVGEPGEGCDHGAAIAQGCPSSAIRIAQ